MAKDFQLKHLCPHQVIGEWITLNRDGKTLRPLRYPSSSQVRIEIDGLEIPKEGIYSTPSIAGRQRQPFSIYQGKNDTLKIKVDSEDTQTIILPQGKSVNTSSIVRRINESAIGFEAVDNNGLLTLKHKRSGKGHSLMLDGGNAHATLGFPPTRFYRSDIIYPAWDLVKPPNESDELLRLIVFETPIPNVDSIFEVSYVTRREDCRRCMGLGIEHDLRHDERGDPEFLRDVDLLVQEVEKIVFTIRGSNVFYTWYGTSINDLVGRKIVGGGQFLETQLLTELSSVLERYRNVKQQQSKHQPVTDQEMLVRVNSINVQQDPSDPTIFRVQVDLQNRSGVVDSLNKILVVKYIDDFEFVE